MSLRRRFWALVALTVLLVLGLLAGLICASGQEALGAVRDLADAGLLAQYGIDGAAQPSAPWLAGLLSAGLMGLAVGWVLFGLALKRQRAAEAARRLDALDRILSGQPAVAEDPRDLEAARLHQISTKLRQSAERSRTDKRQLQSLITDISHQIKTPLSSIRMFNELLIEGGQTPEEAREFLLRSGESVRRLEWLTESLMLISRMETGLIAIRQQDCDLYETMFNAVDALRHKAAEKGIGLSCAGEPLTVAHDPRWTGEAIQNMIDNAIKYGRPGGHVRVALVDLDTAARVDVVDDGPGVAPGEVNRIFQRFHRGEAAEASGADGAGVGLYLCRAILQAQRGSVIVEPTPGGGATFRAFLTKLSSSEPSAESGA